MGEFVKFLPEVVNGSLPVIRQLFYLPPFAITVSVALLICSRQLGYPWPIRAIIALAAIPVSLQLLPPAWSPNNLLIDEFRLQTIALGLCWLLLAGTCLLGRLPIPVLASLSAMVALAAIGGSGWQFLAVQSAISAVYGLPPAVGWGFPLCMVGLLVMGVTSLLPMTRNRARR
jgi:hypothetical protein